MVRVGWIGLGAMGAPMAAAVARAGHEVTAFDIDAGRITALADDGVLPATTIGDAAKGADVLAIMVATPAQGEAVLFGEGGAAELLDHGSVVLVMSTVGVAAVTSWSARLANEGIEMVDAPVSGGVARAASGDLLMMVGGSSQAVATIRPLLDAMAGNAPVVGSAPGDGQKLKLVNQLLCGVHIAAAAEALAFADSMGLDAGTCWEVLRHGAAASFMFEDRGARMVEGCFDQVKSALDIFVKDLNLVVDAAQKSQASTMLAAAAQQVFRMGAAAGLGRLDDSSVIRVYDRLSQR
jgi:3-hydroxyisobutyrate dehydrogenase/putative dehydrogenase